MILTEFDLKQIEKRLGDATQGPWEISQLSKSVVLSSVNKERICKADGKRGTGSIFDPIRSTSCDSVFIASAYQDVKNLIETIRELNGEKL